MRRRRRLPPSAGRLATRRHVFETSISDWARCARFKLLLMLSDTRRSPSLRADARVARRLYSPLASTRRAPFAQRQRD